MNAISSPEFETYFRPDRHAEMYEDDLSDILPRLPNRQAALPSFNDDHDDPFKNPFGGGTDPWATYGQSSGANFILIWPCYANLEDI